MRTRVQTWQWVVAGVLIGVLVVQAAPVIAQSYDPNEDMPQSTRAEKMLTKLGRGLSNIMLGWAEIPLSVDKSIKDGRSFGYMIGVAPVLGVAKATMRTSTGVYETVSFPFSSRVVNYEPILEPEFIF